MPSTPSLPIWLWINFKIGALSVGSASRILLYEEEVCALRGWLSPSEFQEALTLSQVLPGPNLVNLAACVGCRCFGVPAAMLAVLPLIVPGAVLAVLVALWVPLDQPDIAVLFRGFAIGSFLLLGKFLWQLQRGLQGLEAGQKPLKSLGRYVIAALVAAGVFCQVPILILISAGALAGVAWEFTP